MIAKPDCQVIAENPGILQISSNNILNQLPFEEGQSLVAAEVRVGQSILIDAQLVQDRVVDVAEMVGFFDGV